MAPLYFLLIFGVTHLYCQVNSPESPALLDARRLVGSGQLPAAEITLRRLLSADDMQAEVHYLLGYVLFREKRPAESLAEYTSGARLRRPNPQELEVVASDYIFLKDYADAERWLQSALTQDPSDARAWYLLGRTQFNEDHALDAAASFQHCLSLRPRDIKAQYNLGLAFEKLNRLDDAISAYSLAIQWERQQAASDPQPYLDLGMLYIAKGQAERALEPLREAVLIDARNPLAAQELGLALEALGRFEEALASLRRAADLAPKARGPHFFLGRIYRRLGRSKEAAAQFALVAELAKDNSDTATPNDEQDPH